jgi:hypothetical protein
MHLTQEETGNILKFVKKEPRTVQEISKLIGRSWVTTDSYLKRIKDETGLIEIKTFRKGSQAALKIVFYNSADSVIGDALRDELYSKIRSARMKKDFDFLDIFQLIQDKKKKSFLVASDKIERSRDLVTLLRRAESSVFIFSGNLSFINLSEGNVKILSVIEELLERKVHIKILCRINLASISNAAKIRGLMGRYPEFIELRHCYQPLRGFIIDDKIARFKQEEDSKAYRQDELSSDVIIYYEFYDADWIAWLEKVFWNIFRVSSDCEVRMKELKKL